jgi:tetratricopeptide (TPR) repeat protein
MQYINIIFYLILLVLTACDQAVTTSDSTNHNIPEITLLDREILKNPAIPYYYMERGALYYQYEAYDKAILDFQNVIRLDSSISLAWHRLADTYLDYYKSGLALETMERAAIVFPGAIPTLLKLSEFQLILKRHQDGLSTLQKIFSIDPSQADAYFMKGMILKELGDTTQAITAFQNATSENPDLADAWINISHLLINKNPQEAVKYLETAALIQPENKHILFAKANFLASQNLPEEAVIAYRNLIRIHSDFADAYYNLGLLYLDLDSLQQAYHHFDIVTGIEQTYVKAYYYRGLVAERSGDLIQAKRDYEQTLRFTPEYKDAKAGLERVNLSIDNSK